MNSRQKGKRGERQWRDELRANGYDARRGQQFAGSPESPDVICDALPWIHFEVKLVERLRVQDAMDQACRDAGRGKVPVVAHKRNFRPWLVTIEAETFFRLLRGDFPQPRMDTDGHGFLQPGEGAKEGGLPRAQAKTEIWAEEHLRPTVRNEENKLQKETNETES
ncbi:MAG: hypothetical protein ACK4UN_17060 [Limisphaerales bacterium]